MATKEKKFWISLIFMLSGLVVGGLLGELAKSVDWLWWLSYGEEFGLSDPISLDLKVLKLSFSLAVRINISSIIGLAMAIFVYRKI